MPKMKSHTGCKKRLKKNSAGKIKRSRAYKRHHSWAKSSKQVRALRGTDFLDSANKRYEKLLPY